MSSLDYNGPEADCSDDNGYIHASVNENGDEAKETVLMVGLIALILCLCLIPMAGRAMGYFERKRLRRQQAESAKTDAEKRLATIDSCLVHMSKVKVPPSSSELENAEQGSIHKDDDGNDSTAKTFVEGDKRTQDELDCYICLEQYKLGDEMTTSRVSDCQHAFHRECITEWLQEHEDCPCCRATFIVLGKVKAAKEELDV